MNSAWQRLAQRAQDNRRRMVLFAGAGFELPDAVVANLHTIDAAHLRRRAPGETDRLDRLQALLGTEHPALLIDARQDSDPETLAAALGTLSGGGVAIVRHDWNPAHSSFFSRWLDAAIDPLPSWISLDPDAPKHSGLRVLGWTAELAPPCRPWRTEQEHALQRLKAIDQYTESCCVLIEGARGRGKSTLLARWLNDRDEVAVLCASRASHVTSLLSAVQGTGASLKRTTVDQALEKQADCIVIDEAATLPLPVLEALAKRCRLCVMATTTDGYEGSGRALSQRLLPRLLEFGLNTEQLSLSAPVRWNSDDAVEPWLNQTLLLDAHLPDAHLPTLPDQANTITLRTLDTLAAAPALIQSTIALLRATHYQTTLRDLKHLFDLQHQCIVVALSGERVCAVLWAVPEGPIAAERHEAILRREHRVRDQLLPQIAAHNGGGAAALANGYWRVLRIAVHPALRRQGLGRTLIERLKREPRPDGRLADLIGASFGADEHTLAFWQALGFTLIYRGTRPNPRSALPSACMLSTNRLTGDDPP